MSRLLWTMLQEATTVRGCAVCGYSFDEPPDPRPQQCRRKWVCPKCRQTVCCRCLKEHSQCDNRMCSDCLAKLKNSYKPKEGQENQGMPCPKCNRVGTWKSVHYWHHTQRKAQR